MASGSLCHEATTTHPQPAEPPPASAAFRLRRPRRRVSHGAGFWFVGYAFAVVMAFAAMPTPLYVLYARRDDFSSLVVTCVFAAYAVGVMAGVFLLGHVSDWLGRRKLLLAALFVSLVAGGIFIATASLAWLVVARVVSGLAVGIVTATATAHLAELHARHRPDASARRGQIVAVAANLGGIGLGPLVAGVLAQYLPDPLRTPYIAGEALLVLAVFALALTPETVNRRREIAYRLQRIAVPADARRTFAAAAAGAAVTFTVFGVFSALVPSILTGTLHESSHLAAGAVAASVFLASAAAQVFGGHSSRPAGLRAATAITTIGLAVLALATWTSTFWPFAIGAVVTGVGAGLVFKTLLAVVVALAPSDRRSEVLAAFFLAAYLGLVVPVICLGVLDQFVSSSVLITVFAVVSGCALASSVRLVRTPQQGPPIAR